MTAEGGTWLHPRPVPPWYRPGATSVSPRCRPGVAPPPTRCRPGTAVVPPWYRPGAAPVPPRCRPLPTRCRPGTALVPPAADPVPPRCRPLPLRCRRCRPRPRARSPSIQQLRDEPPRTHKETPALPGHRAGVRGQGLRVAVFAEEVVLHQAVGDVVVEVHVLTSSPSLRTGISYCSK